MLMSGSAHTQTCPFYV